MRIFSYFFCRENLQIPAAHGHPFRRMSSKFTYMSEEFKEEHIPLPRKLNRKQNIKNTSLDKTSFVQKVQNTWKTLFPDQLFGIFLVCVVIKLVFFGYRLYILSMDLSQARDTIFNHFLHHWWHLEGLSDFQTDYLLFRENWRNGEILYSSAFNGQFDFPPLYYYLLFIFTWWTPYSAPIMLLIFHIATGLVLYSLFREWHFSIKAAKISVLLFLLSPINLYYSDFIWQYPSMVLFFLSLAMLKFVQQHYFVSMLALGAAMSVHQIIFWIYPFFVIVLIVIPISRKQTFLLMGIPLLEFLFFSFPYLILVPGSFIDSLFSNVPSLNLGEIQEVYSHIDVAVSNGEFVGYFPDFSLIGKSSFRVNYRSSIMVAVLWLGYVFGVSLQVLGIIGIIFELEIFLGLFYCVFLGMFWFYIIYEQKHSGDNFALTWKKITYGLWNTIYLVLFAYLLFNNGGIYKFHMIWLTPFWASIRLFSSMNITQNKNQKKQSFSLKNVRHVFEIILIQLIILYSHKWLAPLLLYFPIFCISAGNYLQAYFSLEKFNLNLNQGKI